MKLTDFAICFTYNWDPEHRLQVRQSGSGYGLQLTLNIEQYEYMASPEKTAGIKVLIHSPDELQRVVDLGFNVPPGMQGLAGMQFTQVQNVPWKEPFCRDKELKYFKDLVYSGSVCESECMTDFLRNKCLCHLVEVPRIPLENATDGRANDEPDCNPYDYQFCIRPSLREFHDEVECDCPVSCRTSSYLPIVTYASLSRFSARRTLLENPERLKSIERKFLRAREAEARARDAEGDRKRFRDISQILQDMALKNMAPESEKLALLRKEVWLPCFNNSIDIVAQYRQMSSKALTILEYLVYPLTDYDRGLLITIYVQMLWSVGIRLELIELAQITPLLESIQKKENVSYSSAMKILRNDALKIEGFISDIIADFNYTSNNLMEFLDGHSFLEKDTEFAEYSQGLRNFSIIQNTCLPEFKTDIKAAFVRLFGILGKVISSRSVSIEQNAEMKQIFDELVADRKQCQIHQINNAKYSRESFERFYKALIRDVRLKEEQMYSEFRAPFKDLETWNFQLDNGKMMITTFEKTVKEYWAGNITKLELAKQLTGNKFQDEITMFQAFLQGIRGYVQENRQAMVNYLHGFADIPNGTAPIIRGFYQHDNNSAYRLYFEGNLFSDDEVHYCINEVEESTNDLVKRVSRMEREIVSRFYEMTRNLEKYKDLCEMNTEFTMTNFLDLSIYFRELREERITQQSAYSFWGLLSDVGGGMGLFLGASFITVCELFDTLFHSSRHHFKRKKVKHGGSNHHANSNGFHAEQQHHGDDIYSEELKSRSAKPTRPPSLEAAYF